MGSKRQLKCMKEIGYSRPCSSQADGNLRENKESLSAEKKQFKKKTNQHQNKKLGRKGVLQAVS